MSVWFAIPSVGPVASAGPIIAKWRERGYKIALLRQGENTDLENLSDIWMPTGTYLGWARSVNILCRKILQLDPGMEWVVTGGDDQLPEHRYHAEYIGKRCSVYFGLDGERRRALFGDPSIPALKHDTFGIMQPTGDLYSGNKETKAPDILHSAGSPWMGRKWIETAYQGKGPLCEEYFHYFPDLELQMVAIKLGVFWQAEEFAQVHLHWSREKGGKLPDYMQPSYLRYDDDKITYHDRLANRFPGHEPL